MFSYSLWGLEISYMQSSSRNLLDLFYGLLNMVLKVEDSKSKSMLGRMFGLKEKKTSRVAKYFSEEEESQSGSNPTMPTVLYTKSLRTFVATWNVGGNPPPNVLNLDDFLQVHDQPDIYILGFQEIVPLNAGNVLVLEDNEPAAKWLSLINQSLNKSSVKASKLMSTPSGSGLFFQKHSLKAANKHFRTESKKKLKSCNCVSEMERRYLKDSCFRCQQSDVSEADFSSEEDEGPDVIELSSASNSLNQAKYGLVTGKQMVGIFLTIWAKRELIPHISHMRISYITRGLMGCLGNKGCISVSMSLYGTSFCFISSHLASGEKEGDERRRNSDVIEILRNTQFPRVCKLPNSGVPERILDHDRVIWLGDLNYRITLSYAETRKLLDMNDWDSLLSKDQLKTEREAGRVFKGWKEGKIWFAPTYKYSFNSNTYFSETNTSKNKRRTPAWCDRILWHGNGIRQLSYVRKDSKEFQFSDHRPVCAMFLVEVWSKDGSRSGISNSNTRVEIEELLPTSTR
ncbi:hypothetical protein V2J09_001268 [Rumex salicifolius]